MDQGSLNAMTQAAAVASAAAPPPPQSQHHSSPFDDGDESPADPTAKGNEKWKISLQDWHKIFLYVQKNMNRLHKPGLLYNHLSEIGVPIEGSKDAFCKKWGIMRTNMKNFAKEVSDANRSSINPRPPSQWDLAYIKSLPIRPRNIRKYQDPLLALELGRHVKQRKSLDEEGDDDFLSSLPAIEGQRQSEMAKKKARFSYDSDDEDETVSEAEERLRRAKRRLAKAASSSSKKSDRFETSSTGSTGSAATSLRRAGEQLLSKAEEFSQSRTSKRLDDLEAKVHEIAGNMADGFARMEQMIMQLTPSHNINGKDKS